MIFTPDELDAIRRLTGYPDLELPPLSLMSFDTLKRYLTLLEDIAGVIVESPSPGIVAIYLKNRLRLCEMLDLMPGPTFDAGSIIDVKT